MTFSAALGIPPHTSISSLTHDQLSEHIRLAKVNPGHYQAVSEELERELSSRSPTATYKCMKCGHEKYEVNQIRTTRTWLSSLFGVESAQYNAIICARCKFTEFYQGTVPFGQQALDVVFGQ
jgi:predicted nucleic-acid-binding Zn-ribbon protein